MQLPVVPPRSTKGIFFNFFNCPVNVSNIIFMLFNYHPQKIDSKTQLYVLKKNVICLKKIIFSTTRWLPWAYPCEEKIGDG
jgi:hypothetical protein